MQISGETARYELTHLNLYCLHKAQYCLLAPKELNDDTVVDRELPYSCADVLNVTCCIHVLCGRG